MGAGCEIGTLIEPKLKSIRFFYYRFFKRILQKGHEPSLRHRVLIAMARNLIFTNDGENPDLNHPISQTRASMGIKKKDDGKNQIFLHYF